MRHLAFILLLSSVAHAGIIRQDVRHFSANGSTGLIGDVTISAGNNITLNQVGQNITITANGGSPTEAIATKTSDYIITTSDYNILANTAGGTFTIGAQVSTMTSGHAFCVKLIAPISVAVSSADLIDGASTFIMSKQNSSFCFKSNGSTFYVF